MASPMRAVPSDVEVTVCIYRGAFVAPAGPPGPDGNSEPRNAMRLLVMDDGSVVLDSFGYAGRMAPDTPRDLAGG